VQQSDILNPANFTPRCCLLLFDHRVTMRSHLRLSTLVLACSVLLADVMASSTFGSKGFVVFGQSVHPTRPSTTTRRSVGGSVPRRSALKRRATLSDKSIGGAQLSGLAFLDQSYDDDGDDSLRQVKPCRSIGNVLVRGALLRIASDLTGGTPFESIKTRVTVTKEGPWQAYRNIVKGGGFSSLWTGTPSRTVEGALIGAVFMLASTLTKTQMKTLGASSTVAALTGGLVGGIAQAFIMTPAGMVFTSLNYNNGKKGYEHDNALVVTRRIVKEKGFMGMFLGFKPMAIRQASNWASRAGFTEICRSTLGMSNYGLLGELGSGMIGGLGSCWNTPIETIRVYTQRDVSSGVKPKTMSGYWNDILERDGYPGLFRGITPRALQAIWQTTFLVVVPNLMGI
jgi:Mitochondrial carrier protein